MKSITRLLIAALVSGAASATEFHVATNGNDGNRGTKAAPLRTIQRAADRAQPGDVITVHEGTYRERVTPPRGGESDAKRIVYQAAKGEKVEIKGSEVVKNWVKVQEDVWKVSLPNSFFGGFNPYRDLIRGDWFNRRGRDHHTGAVYLNGDWLTEAAKLEEVLKPGGNTPLWFGQVDAANTTLWAQFPGVNPNEQLVEINVRQTVFYPDKPGRNYITVRGFTMRHAATPWAPPTAEQIGLIGTHWSKGWIIENNVISHSVCSGVALGKHGDQYDNTSADTAEGYVKTIERAHAHAIPWTRENIGHHVVRNNTISHCEQTGVVGSLGAAFSSVTGNTIHDIHVRALFSGAEMAGIKLHAAIDVTIRDNHLYRTCRGLWLDWMAQGTRVSANLFHDNAAEDLFVEVNHGPFLVDNNLFLSAVNLLDMSEGGAYAHNLFAGKITNRPEPSRDTPYHPAHSTTVAGLVNTQGGDDRFYSNLFVGNGEALTSDRKGNLKELRWISSFGLWGYDGREFPLQTGGNVYYRGAEPYARETGQTVVAGTDPKVKLVPQGERFFLQISPGSELKQASTVFVTTKLLGQAKISGLRYENADGSPLKVDTDYFGKKRSQTKPTAGPFENPGKGDLRLKVW
jgi:alpha-N-arabinofuranosidase